MLGDVELRFVDGERRVPSTGPAIDLTKRYLQKDRPEWVMELLLPRRRSFHG